MKQLIKVCYSIEDFNTGDGEAGALKPLENWVATTLFLMIRDHEVVEKLVQPPNIFKPQFVT